MLISYMTIMGALAVILNGILAGFLYASGSDDWPFFAGSMLLAWVFLWVLSVAHHD